MKKVFKIQSFVKDTNAVSEEFTVLPALSIVMVGFALFVVLLAQAYLSYTDHINRLQNYQTADHILKRITNPDCYFIKEAGVIDIQTLENNTAPLQRICEQYKRSGVTFFLRLSWNNQSIDFPEMMLLGAFRCIAVSKDIGIFLNEAQTVPGVLTVLLWEGS